MDADFTASTRDAWDRTYVNEIYRKMIIFDELFRRGQVVVNAGGMIQKKTVQYADLSSLFNEYGPNDIPTSDSKAVFTSPYWYMKTANLPIRIPAPEADANTTAGGNQILNLVTSLVTMGQEGVRQGLCEAMYRSGDSTRDGERSSNAQFQGLCDALTHDITYGSKTRATTATNKWFQGASIARTYADWDTEIGCNISNFRSATDACTAYTAGDVSDLLCITSNTNFRTLQSQAEGSVWYKSGDPLKYGFEHMFIDNIRVVAEPWFTSPSNSDASTQEKYFFMLNMKNIEFRVNSKRKLGTFTGLKHQIENINGTDDYFGQFLLMGNLIDFKPNESIFLSTMV